MSGEEGAEQGAGNTELNALRAAAIGDPRLAALLEHADEPFTWQCDVLTMMAIIGQVQLALRHPSNAGEQGRLACAFVRSVQQQIASFDVRLSSLIEDGFNPAMDAMDAMDAGKASEETARAEELKEELHPFRIERVWAFVVQDRDGCEGIPAVSLPDGLVMPLMGADAARVEALRPIALELAAAGHRVVLARFDARTEEEVMTS